MKKNKIFLKMAALAVMGTMMSGCAEEIEALQTANQTVIQKITISLADDAGTRGAITIDTDSKKGITSFSEGDMIAVIYQNASGNTVKALSAALTSTDLISEGASATFTVGLNSPLAGGYVRYIYPASMAAAETDIVPEEVPSQPTSIDETLLETLLATQDGTLETIASSLGLAVYDGQMSATATLPTGTDVKLENQLAIGKFTIKNGSGDDITSTITSLSINDGYNTYTVTTTTQLSTFYVAMLPITSTQTVILNATDGTNHYTKSVTNNPLDASKTTLEASNIYDITVNTIAGANLSLVTANYTAKDGEVLSGTLGSNVKISIAAGATVTLNNLTINGVNNYKYNWSGITAEGDATIILADGSMNTVNTFYSQYPGIIVAESKTLIIKGNGTLDVCGGDFAAGIGGGESSINCGNIEIQGGTINATGGDYAAGIGGGNGGSCGNITISGGTITASSDNFGAGIGGGNGGSCGNITISDGTITATSGRKGAGIGGGNKGNCGTISISGGTITATSSNYGAGIGGGCGDPNDTNKGKCGTITITNGVTKVTATMGPSARNSIGRGDYSSCGTVTIAGKTVPTSGIWDGTGMTGLTLTGAGTDTWTLSHGAASAGPGDLGKVIGADGNIYATAAQASAAGTTAEAMIAYVGSASNCTHGLAIALESAPACKWDDRASTLATWAASHSVVNGEWRVPSDADLKYMFEACGGPSSSTPTEDSGYLGNAGPYSYGSLPTMLASLNSSYDIRGNACWTNTEDSENLAWVYFFNDDADHSGFTVDRKDSNYRLRAILAF